MFMLAVALVPIAALLPPGVVSACRRDDVKPLRRLLDKGAFDVNDVDDEGSTLLMIAAFDVRVPHVRLLLERGADPNLADHDGGNALLNAGIIASGFAHSHISLSQAEAAAAAREIGIMLIQSGARFLPLPKGVPEALMEGPKSWYAEVREVADGVREVADGMRESRPHGWNDDVNYIDPVSGCTRLHTATINGNVDIVRRLLKGGADPDVLTKRPTKRAQETIPSLANAEEGSTALMLAVPNGNAPIVELLIKAGASLDLRNRYDNTALFLAASKGNVGIVRRLLDAGAHVDRRGGGSGAGDESSTPLDYAAHAGHSEVVGLLLKAGAELEARSEPGGNTPLISALKAGTCLKGKKPRKQGEGALAQLIAAGANANARQRDGDTALLVAISTGCLHLVTMLLDAGADPNLPSAAVDGASATTQEGCTPLIAAAAYGEPEMARVLLDAGASASTRDGEGFRAIDWALAENSKPDVAAGRKATAQILRSKTPSPALAPYGPKHSRAQSSARPLVVNNAGSAMNRNLPEWMMPELPGRMLGGSIVMPADISSSGGSSSNEVNDPLLDLVDKQIRERTKELLDKDRAPTADRQLKEMRDYASAVRYMGQKAELLRMELSQVWNCHEGNSIGSTDWWANARVEGKQLPCPGVCVRTQLLSPEADPQVVREAMMAAVPSIPSHRPRNDRTTNTMSLIPEVNHEDLSDPRAVIRLLDQRLAGFTEEVQEAISSDSMMLPWLQQDQDHLQAEVERSGLHMKPIDLASGAVKRDAYLLLVSGSIISAFIQAHVFVADVELRLQPDALMRQSGALVAGEKEAAARFAFSLTERVTRLSNDLDDAKAEVERLASLLHWGKNQRRPDLGDGSRPKLAPGSSREARRAPRRAPRDDAAEGSSGWFVPVFVSVCVGLVSLVLNLILRYQNAAEAGEQPREAEGRRRGRGRRGNGQDRGRGGNGQRQGRGRGQARAAADPPAPMPAPTPTPPVAYTTVDEPDWWLALTDFHDDLDAAARQDRPDFLCPVTAEIMRAPYLLVDGHESLHTYEYNVLVNWFITEGNDSDPVRNTRIEPARRNFISDGRLGREIRSWCEEKVRKWRQELKSQASASTDRAAARTDVHVFVDHSNALIGALKAGTKLDLARLAQCVEAGREVRERVVLGSLETERNRAAWEQLGYTVTADTRPGKEHLIDDALHAQLMRTAAKRFDPARVIALVTGDGNDNEGRTTFPQCIEEALKNDWHVELHSWRRSMNRVYVAFAEQYPTHFSFHILDSSLAVVAGWA